MVKAEWKEILNNKFILVALIAIGLIPMLYSIIFLGSMWDPYGNVSDLPVAVVNEDQSVEFEGETLAIGDELVSNMKKDMSLDFHFVTAQEATRGLEDGDYYMVITIPENFSEKATTLMDEQPQQMVLEYETTQGRSFISSKMSDSAMVELKNKVSEQVTALYTAALLSQLEVIGEGMDTAADGSQQLVDGTDEILDGSQQISENLERLYKSTLTFSDGINTFDNGLSQYVEGVNEVNEGANQINDGIHSLADGANEMANGMEALSQGAKSLNSGLSNYTDGVNTLSEGAAALASTGKTLLQGHNTFMSSIETGATDLSTGASSLQAGLQALSDSIPEEAHMLVRSLQQLQASIANLSSVDLSTIKASLVQIQSSINELTPTHDAVIEQIKQTEAYQRADEEQKAELISAVSGTTNNPSVSELAEISASFEALIEQISLLETNSGVAALAQVNAASQQIIPNAVEAISGLSTIKSTVDQQLLPGAEMLDSGLSTLSSSISSNATALTLGLETYVAGVNAVNDGAKALAENSSSLLSGASQLTSGLMEMNGELPTLTSGVAELQKGANALAIGVSELASKNPELMEGVAALQDGASQLADGAGQLDEAEKTVVSGLEIVEEGLTTLTGQLRDASNEIAAVNPHEDNADAIAAPVTTEHTDKDRVPNNGTAMAPYMMSVALFVGGVAISTIYDLYEPHQKPTSGVAWWASKMSVLFGLGLVQSIVMLVALMIIEGLEPSHYLSTFMVLIVESLTFMSIIAFFNLVFKKAGAFMVLIFMILQLSGSGGTYPIQLSGSFYQAIHGYLPMTYGIEALRKTLAMDLSPFSDVMVLLGIGVVFNGLIIAYFSFKTNNSQDLVTK